MGIAAIYRKGETGRSQELPVSIFKVRTAPTSKIISAPVEDGIEVPDMKVRMPKTIVVSCVVVNDENAQRAISTINRMYEERELEFYQIHDGIEFHGEDFILQDAPHDHGTRDFDFLNYELTFKEVMRVSGREGLKTLNAENTDIRDFGFNQAIQMMA